MKKQRMIAVSGVKNSGKTTLLEKMIPVLAARGIRCAVIKHDGHRFLPDREGTDTFRTLSAGAVGTAVFDGEKYQAVKYAAVTETDLTGLFPEADLILLEGLKHSDYPKIEIVRGAVSSTPVCDPESLLCLVTDTTFRIPGKPAFLPDDIGGLVDFLQEYLEKDDAGPI